MLREKVHKSTMATVGHELLHSTCFQGSTLCAVIPPSVWHGGFEKFHPHYATFLSPFSGYLGRGEGGGSFPLFPIFCARHPPLCRSQK